MVPYIWDHIYIYGTMYMVPYIWYHISADPACRGFGVCSFLVSLVAGSLCLWHKLCLAFVVEILRGARARAYIGLFQSPQYACTVSHHQTGHS